MCRYVKALYREYTDATFTVLRNRSGDDLHLGLLGPLIRAQVGDTLRILFKNNLKRSAGKACLLRRGIKMDQEDWL